MGYIRDGKNVRSRRSQKAIDNYEIPLSLFNKDTIRSFTESFHGLFSGGEFLHLVNIDEWRYIAKEYVAPTSFHHEGNNYSFVAHYCLRQVAESIIENKDEVFLFRKNRHSVKKPPKKKENRPRNGKEYRKRNSKGNHIKREHLKKNPIYAVADLGEKELSIGILDRGWLFFIADQRLCRCDFEERGLMLFRGYEAMRETMPYLTQRNARELRHLLDLYQKGHLVKKKAKDDLYTR